MLKIYDDTHPILRKVAEPVELPLSEENTQLLLAMLEHLKQSQDEEFAKKHNLRGGVGLAAPQVGVSKRLIVLYYLNETGQYTTYMLANPKIVAESIQEAYLAGGEGCLSVPEDHEGEVFRHYKITVKAFDLHTNENIKIKARGYDAVVLQHEIDHLNGVLYYDRIDHKKAITRRLKAFKI